MLGSLRARILVSHVAVILLVFGLTFIVAFIPIRNAQNRLEIQRLEALAAPVAVGSGFLLGRPALSQSAIEDLDTQAVQLNVRLVLIDRDGAIVHDTKPADPLPTRLMGKLRVASLRLDQRATAAGGARLLPLEDRSIYIGTSVRNRVVLTLLPQVDGRYIAILAPRGTPLLREFVLPVVIALCVGFIGALIATLFLSRSIARPISRLTQAANAVAGGDLNRSVPDEGNDEVGRLVRSFNEMVTRLRLTYESQRRLLANIAHELRTPLTSIQGYAQGLSDGVFVTEEQRQDALDTIGEESERVNDLLVQILELARLESRQSGPRVREVDVDDIIGRVLRRHRVEADNNGIGLAGPAPGSRKVLGDEGLIDQAIDNLVRNAIRHTPEGGHVDVGVSSSSSGTRGTLNVRIRVSDTGSGIPPEALPHIFDRFYRANGEELSETETGNGHGFGLGLSIVREIASSHGGSVNVESELGKGTTFVLELPGLDGGRSSNGDRGSQ